MSDLRLNRVAREWVVITSDRARRPGDFRSRRERQYVPEHDPSCPFCPGNEDKTPEDLVHLREGEEEGWCLRAFDNRFAVFSKDGERGRRNDGIRHMAEGVGRHEIVVETPLHNGFLHSIETACVERMLRVYRDRLSAMFEDERVEHVIIFKNHGERSGTSLLHPHSQVVGMPVTPFQIRDRLEAATRHFDMTGRCLLCECLADELRDRERVILETDLFVAFIPYAALSPFHIWIFPKRHMASYSGINDGECGDLAAMLQSIIARLYHGLDDPDFNFVIRTEGPGKLRSPYFHWYLSLVPRLVQPSGIALGSGVFVNQTLPEEVAHFLREVKVPGK